MKFSFKLKLFFTFIVYGLSLVLLTQLVLFKIDEISIKSASIKKASEAFKKKDALFTSYIKDTNLKMLSILKYDIFNKYLENQKDMNLPQKPT